MLPAGPAVTVPAAPAPEAEEFVRFCYARRRVGWPELYDEMCAVASRGLFRGMGPAELAEIGIGFSLFETPRLAVMVQRLVADEQARRARARSAAIAAAAAAGLVESQAAGSAPVPAPASDPARVERQAAEPVALATSLIAPETSTTAEPERNYGLPRLVLAATA